VAGETGQTPRCQEIRDACGEVGTAPTCEHTGAVVSGEKTVECVWLEGNDTREIEVLPPRCAQKVLGEESLLL
jgi:hypothetical protein